MSANHNTPLLKNEVLTVKEVANYLRVNRVTVWRWCKQGTIPAFRAGHGWRIRRDDLMKLLDSSEDSGLGLLQMQGLSNEGSLPENGSVH